MYIPTWLIVILCIIFIEPILSILFSLLILGFYLFVLLIPFIVLYYIINSKNDWLLFAIGIPLIIYLIINEKRKNIKQGQNRLDKGSQLQKLPFSIDMYINNLKTNCLLYFKKIIKRKKNYNCLNSKNHFDILRNMNK